MSDLQNIQITFKNTPTLRHDDLSLDDPHLMPVYIVSGVAAGLFIIAPFLAPRGPNQGIVRWCVALTIVSCWLLWVSIYLGQMNPLIGPRMSNTSLAWVGYCWGTDPKKLEEGAGGGGGGGGGEGGGGGGGEGGEGSERGGDKGPPSHETSEPSRRLQPEEEGGRRSQAPPKSLPTRRTY